MDQSFWAGVAYAETASQLALCGVLIAGYCTSNRFAARDRQWLVHSAGSLGSGLVSAAIAASVLGSDSSSRALGAGFAAGLVVLVLATSYQLVPRLRDLQAARLYQLFCAAVVLASVLFWWFPPLQRGLPSGFGGAEPLVLSSSGRVLAAVLAALLAYAVLPFRRAPDADKAELACLRIGYLAWLALFLFDILGIFEANATVPLLTHAGLLWALMLGATSLVRRKRMIERAESIQSELTRCREELGANHASLERMQGELGTKKQLAAVGELAAAIAHEVRNPLAIIMNAAAGLRRPTLQIDDRNTLLGILDEETARLNRLVTDLLRFARPVTIKRSSVSITELAKRVEGRLEDHHVLSVEIPDNPLLRVVQADANLLRLVFDNLVSNAFQAMPDGGTVRIVVGEQDVGDIPFVRIEIVDHGHGMDEQVLDRATDPFYTTRPSGTGLGLPIVQRIVEAHGGRIEIESAPGQGTKVIMYLPKLPPADDNTALSDAAPQRVGLR